MASNTHDSLSSGAHSRRFSCWAGPATIIAAVFCGLIPLLLPARAQDERRTKVPVIGKITDGAAQLAFIGKVQALDLKRELLNVSTVEGGGTEFFPIRKKMSVSTATGEKMKLTELKAGTDIIVYYEKKGDRRTVKEIVVLAAGSADEAKKSPPPS